MEDDDSTTKDMNKEDGELEDGELDDEEEVADDSKSTLDISSEAKADRGDVDYRKSDIDYRNMTLHDTDMRSFDKFSSNRNEEWKPVGDDFRKKSESASEDNNDDSRRHKKEDKRKKRKRKRDKAKEKNSSKKRKKQPHYVDYDREAEGTMPGNNDMADDYFEGWPGGNRKSAKNWQGSSPQGSAGSHGSPTEDKSRQPLKYDSPYESPPGPYDSPSDEEYLQEKHRKLDQGEDRMMLGMMATEVYTDATVAAQEKQEVFKGGPSQESRRRKAEKSRKYKELQKQRQWEAEKRARQQRHDEESRLVCKYFAEGKCQKGDRCTYRHDKPLEKRPILCKHYMRGSCSRDICIFMHGEYPCKYFYQNKCDMGDHCKFSHGELTEETRTILEQCEGVELERERDVEPTQPKVKKPSLLGSPPRHLKEQLENRRKIPSLFDIKVEPPKKNPQGPPPNPVNTAPPPSSQMGPNQMAPMGANQTGGPPGPPPMTMMAPGMPGPSAGINSQGPIPMSPQNHPMRPSFYDMSSPRMPPPGMPPPMMGPMGPGMVGPPPPMGNLRPPPLPMGLRGPPNFMGPMNPFFSQPPGPMGMLPGQGVLPLPENTNHELPPELPSDGDGPDSMAILNHLPPQQRELFLRIQQHQKEQNAKESPSSGITGNVNTDESWYSSDEENSPDKSKVQVTKPPPMDLTAMLTMIRQTAAPPQNTPLQSGVKRDPRISTGPETRTVAYTNSIQTSTPIELEVINASLAFSKGVPYVLYRITLENAAPSLPKYIDPKDSQYQDDPRVHRYGKRLDTTVQRAHVVEAPVIPMEKSDPRMVKQLSVSSTPPYDPRKQLQSVADLRKANEQKQPVLSKPALAKDLSTLFGPLTLKQEIEPAIKLMDLPEGLKKPLVPLPTLLDPKIARQLSGEPDEKETKKTLLKSPSVTATNKPAFSHRSDPRFRKKQRDSISGSQADMSELRTDSLGSDTKDFGSRHTSIDSLDDDTSKEQVDTKLNEKGSRDEENDSSSDSKEASHDYMSRTDYYPETSNGNSFTTYNPLTQISGQNRKNTSVTTSFVASQTTFNSSYGTLTTASLDEELLGSVATTSDEQDIKALFKTIDPTASPFGSI